jgi:hypothetical protein
MACEAGVESILERERFIVGYHGEDAPLACDDYAFGWLHEGDILGSFGGIRVFCRRRNDCCHDEHRIVHACTFHERRSGTRSDVDA